MYIKLLRTWCLHPQTTAENNWMLWENPFTSLIRDNYVVLKDNPGKIFCKTKYYLLCKRYFNKIYSYTV